MMDIDKIKKDIKTLLDDSEFTDYLGEDEYAYDYVDKDMAVEKIIDYIKANFKPNE